MTRISRLLAAFLAVLLAALAVPVSPQEASTLPDAGEAPGGEPEARTQAGAETGGPLSRVADPAIPGDQLAHLLIPLTRSELAEVTDLWLANVRAETQRIADLQADIRSNPAQEGDPRFARLTRMVEQRAGLFARFSMAVDSFERKGGDPARVAELRAYREAVLYEETAQAVTGALAGALVTWLGRSDGGIALLKRIGIALLALGAIVLAAIDIDITPLFALIGGASFILAFAFQDTLGNLASGLMILVNQPFDEGDYIDVGGVSGTVQKVSIVATTIATADNKIIVVPNRNVWGNVIVNASASDIRRVDLVFGASYDDPIQEVLDTINAIVAAHPKTLKDPEAQVAANELAASAVNYVCRPWVKADDYLDVYWDLTRQVKEAFDARGLTMPYPQHDVRIRGGLPSA